MELREILDLSGMDKEQLAQLCCALYALLENRNVTVTVQASPNAGSFGFSPVSPFYLPNNGNLGTGDKMPDLPKVWYVNDVNAHNKCVGQVESTQEEKFGTR